MRWTRRQVTVPAPLIGLSMLLIAASSLISSITFRSQAVHANARADRNDAIAGCRSLYGAAVTDATTTYQFATGQTLSAIGDLVVVLAAGGDITGPLHRIDVATTAVGAAATDLDAARNARVEFESHPSGRCSLPAVNTAPPPSSTTTSTTTTLAPPTTAKRKPRTTTTVRPVTTTTAAPATTVFRSSPTTVPPGRICDLLPVSGVPCLL